MVNNNNLLASKLIANSTTPMTPTNTNTTTSTTTNNNNNNNNSRHHHSHHNHLNNSNSNNNNSNNNCVSHHLQNNIQQLNTSLKPNQPITFQQHQLQIKKEITFPANSVEATQPIENKRKKIEAKNIGKFIILIINDLMKNLLKIIYK